MALTGLIWLRTEHVAGCCEYGYEHSDSIQWEVGWLDEKIYMRYDMIWYDMIWCEMIYLLTAIGLTPGGSSAVHIYTEKYTE